MRLVVVSVITEPHVVDRILEHVARSGGDGPFAEGAPPLGMSLFFRIPDSNA